MQIRWQIFSFAIALRVYNILIGGGLIGFTLSALSNDGESILNK